jgi:hypothetical protein
MGQADGMVVRQSAQSRTPYGWSVGSPRIRAVQLDPNRPFLVAVRLMLMMESRCGVVDFRLPLRHIWAPEIPIHTNNSPFATKVVAMHVNLYSNSNREMTRKGLLVVLILMLRHSSDTNLEVPLFLLFMLRRLPCEIH